MYTLERSYATLQSAMSIFGAGYREDAMPVFESLLNNSSSDVTIRIVAACLLGEAYRGIGNFGKAQQFYGISIYESDTVPESVQSLNEYIRHYRPRAFCGLLTVYRRTLFDDHKKIRFLIDEIKSDFNIFRIPDLPAQIKLMEGLYVRQLGELSDSIACISEGWESIKLVSQSTPYFLFLNPEHFEALLMISYLCSPTSNTEVRKISREILNAKKGSWAMAFAAAAQIHLHLRQAANAEFVNFSSNEFGADAASVSNLISILQKNARFENDPLLLTECAILSLIWYMLIEDFNQARGELDTLQKFLKVCSTPLLLLRSVEMGALHRELELAGLCYHPVIKELRDLGQQAYLKLETSLPTYACDSNTIEYWKSLLFENASNAPFILDRWASLEVMALRCRTWP